MKFPDITLMMFVPADLIWASIDDDALAEGHHGDDRRDA
jgi:hypothetical protein